MSTVTKALSLLDLVATLDSDAGLTDLARLAGMDKATTRRLLVDLESHGFVEQDAGSRKYRLGSAPIRLARLREDRFPLLRTAEPFVRALAAVTDETCHLAGYVAGALRNLHVEASTKANRVNVELGAVLPLHATASGLALLSALDRRSLEATLSDPLDAFTTATLTNPEELRRRVGETRARGWSVSRNGFETGVVSTAAVLVCPDGGPVATIAIAAPEARVDDALLHDLGRRVAEAAASISAKLFGNEGKKSPRF